MSEVLVMKKMFVISFEALISYLGVALLILPDSWLDFLPSVATRWFGFYILVVLLLLHTVIRKQRFTFDDAGVLTLAMLYIGMGFRYFIAARAINFQTLLYGMLIVWITDSGAYLIGRKIGKNKLAPKISPNKTWEGSIGAVICALIFSAIYVYLVPTGRNQGLMILLAFFLSIVGQMGDLVESAYKRFYGVKDSGKILPGHGGILDRFDSMLLVLPVVAFMGIL